MQKGNLLYLYVEIRESECCNTTVNFNRFIVESLIDFD